MTENESFITTRDTLKAYIVDNGMVSTLMTKTNTRSRTSFYDTFSVSSSKELVGKKLDIWLAAVELVERAKNKISLAQKALDR